MRPPVSLSSWSAKAGHSRLSHPAKRPSPRLALAACTAALLAAATARADAPAAVQPQHDVDITYKVPVPGGTGDVALLQRYRYSASLHRQRVDLPTSGNWMVLDFTTHRLFAIRDENREIIEAPAPEQVAPGGAGYARVGPADVADRSCTEWRSRDLAGHETITCFTDDGLLLRVRTADRVLMQAIAVKDGPQGADVFALPGSYAHTRQ